MDMKKLNNHEWAWIEMKGQAMTIKQTLTCVLITKSIFFWIPVGAHLLWGLEFNNPF